VFVADITRALIGSHILIAGHYSPVMPMGRLQACKNQSKKPYNKQLINLKCLVFTGKSQTLAFPY